MSIVKTKQIPWRLYTFILCLLLTYLSVCSNAQSLIFVMKDGDKSSFKTEEIQKLTFAADTLHLTKYTNNSEFFLIDKLQFFTFSDTSTTQKTDSYNSIQIESNLIVYPNPVEDMLIIRPDEKINKQGSIKILSYNGKTVITNSFSPGNEIRITMSGIATGIYLCIIQYDDQIFAEKIIKK